MWSQFSREIEVVRPVDADCLVVLRAPEAEHDLGLAHEIRVRQEEAAINVGAVRGVRVDLTLDIDTPDKPIPSTPC
jgi:hypothetical protein